MKPAVAVPVGILASISVLMFVFVWWWFPRHYRKGVRKDMEEFDAARIEREAYDRSASVQGGANAEPLREMTAVEVDDGKGGKTTVMVAKPRGYTAPVTMY